jgi:hypothetical protein
MRAIEDRERQRQQEQARLDRSLSLAQRNRTGQFATPPALALEIVEYARAIWGREKPIRFLEPCIGTGSFYSALLQTFPRGQIDGALGFEIEPGLVKAARTLWRGTGLSIAEGDFTRQQPPVTPFNLLITNPPYVRHHHLPKDQKDRLQSLVHEQTGIRLSGLSGLYCYFILLAHQWLEAHALSVWLVPSEFMDVNYGVAVKDYLTRRARLLRIHRYDSSEVQFDEALVSSAVVAFERAIPGSDDIVRFSFGGSLQRPDREITVSLRELDPAAKWGDAPSVAGRRRAVATLGDLFTIKRGLATGDNEFFILRREDARRIGIPDRFVRPILPPPRSLKQNVIEADDDGYPRLSPQLVLIDCDLTEEELASKFPKFWAYLQRGKRRGVHQSYLAGKRSPWYCQEKRPPAPFLCTYMGRCGNGRKPFRFLWNKSRATAHNVYLLLYPCGQMRAALASDPGLGAEVFALLQKIDTDSFVGKGRVYGGGLYKMEPKELGSIPVEAIFDLLSRQPFRLHAE